ncbi:hypothetical protein N7499_012244 [Penicillium canescens]|uniref:Uncharacterized protein n=1 Tax=Penicillium canescens TaxID=5083 RepID=A0AAD6N4A3_PENCN|nr:uncharacterized protein N7446_001112 [Penicillium canescens]KAJ6029829.1 hypothetical protein N7460_010095 [Penicillium canescens]KAJ6060208.1 hypothetical protein N7444_002062 [Penicillium canescens]KAJ6063564.1 hypothetical protein N7499_012244 [Penicillium canescens]KAJ6078176.1 hypothetical protein N7446_001112 [Penicillium canescens]KAJ6154940.1 hypothetical protein N7485_013309 [Penicillium canescens]
MPDNTTVYTLPIGEMSLLGDYLAVANEKELQFVGKLNSRFALILSIPSSTFHDHSTTPDTRGERDLGQKLLLQQLNEELWITATADRPVTYSGI